MRHLIVSRELPPASYTVGGIGTYVANISRLLADAGETVHLLGERWRGAPDERVVERGGRLVTHRVRSDEPLAQPGRSSTWQEISLLRGSTFPQQAWGWNAALRAEALVEAEQIDIIEAQEWEAPLYYFLLRRALGLGPARQPPVIIQLHSPSEFIWRANQWPVTRPDFLPMRRQEEYCIASADALLCPSRYLARQAEERYGLSENSVTVIPIPIGSFSATNHARGAAAGPIVFVGRLEPRKGPIEFVEAAVRVAADFPEAQFEFLGDDVHWHDHLSVRQHLDALIPRPLRRRFHFRGVVDRPRVAKVLAHASFAVVPSRWENFPNSCVEAMASGVPVLASPNGGMAEMVEDGVTGWIAASQRPADLAAALRRALSTPPRERAAMGRQAAIAIARQCGTEAIVGAQLRLRTRVAQSGVAASSRLPMTTRTAMQPTVPSSVTTVRLDPGESLTSALARTPSDAAIGVAVTFDDFTIGHTTLLMAAAVLQRYPEIGLVSGWIAENPALCGSAPPAFPYQWLFNDAKGVVVFRRQALGNMPAVERDATGEESMWELANAVLAQGWKGVALPMVIGCPSVMNRHPRAAPENDTFTEPGEMLRHFREVYPALFDQDVELRALLLDLGANAADQIQRGTRRASGRLWVDRWRNLTPGELWRLPLRDKGALLGAALRDPRRTLAWLRNHGSRLPGARTRTGK
jgi:glycosyltransferase involved in cell wall biosynthesis